MKKFTLYMLITVIVASLAGCEEDLAVSDETNTANLTITDTDTTNIESEPAYDLDGFALNIVKIPQNDIGWVMVSLGAFEENGEVMNDAIVNRNRVASEKYNFKIIETEISNTAEVVKNMVTADDDEYQAVFCPIDVSLLTNEYLASASDINTLNLDSDCWDQNLLNSFAIRDNIYLLGGDITVADEDSLEVIVYNTSYANTLGLENLYKAVDDGTWTIDKMLSCMKLAAIDLNGDSIMDLEDSYGLISNNDGISAMLVSCGVSVVEMNKTGIPEFAANSDRYQKAFSKLAPVFDKTIWHSYDGVTAELQVSRLENNQQLFVNAVTSFARRFLRDVETDFGFLPTPKLDEAQEHYYTASVPSTCVMSIPKSCSDLDNTGLTLQLLAEESKELSYTYYEVCLQSKYTRDQESYDMLKLSTENVCYDIGYFFNSQFGGLHNKLIEDLLKGGEQMSSIIASSKEMTIQNINNFYGVD